MFPRRNFNHGALNAMWLSFPVSSSASFALKDLRWGPQVVRSEEMVEEMKSEGVPTVSFRRFSVRPRILLTGATSSSCSLSHEMGSCRCAMSECPNKRKMASMLDAIACSNRPMLATSR